MANSRLVSAADHFVGSPHSSHGPHNCAVQRNLFRFIVTGLVVFLCVTGFAQQNETIPGRLLIKPMAHLTDAEFSRRLVHHSAFERHSLARTRVRVVNVPEARTDEILRALNQDPDIEFAEKDYVAHACGSLNDPYVASGSEWHLAKIQALDAWSLTAGISNVVIAVLDSGINAAHPDLAGKILPGYDFVNNVSDPVDDFGHGTAVAGTLIAAGNNNVGVAGVSYGCRILPVKVMDAWGSASHSAIAEGIEFAVQKGARIINLSLGGDWSSSTLQNAINYAWSNNVLVVAAAGNNGSTTPQYPGACDHVLAVASSSPDDSRSWFSSYGSYVTIYAPGENIWTTQRDLSNPYGAWSGTSFSSPVVAGVAALVLSLKSSLANEELFDVLKQTSDDLGAPGYDAVFSYGRINALYAVNAVSPVPAEPVSPGYTNVVLPPPPPAQTPEVVPPTIALLSAPPNNARLFTPGIVLAGVAADNVAIDRVELQLNGGPVQIASGTTEWTASLALVPGQNTVRMWSVDLAGNVSTEVIRIFTYVMTARLTTQLIGMGTIVPDLRGRDLEVGKTYRIRAVPGYGQLFAGWSGGINSDSPLLAFTMQTNLSLVANFVPNPFPAVHGMYGGLMVNTNGVTPGNSGSFALAVGRSGLFSGRVMTAGNRSGFTGRFNLAGESLTTVRRGLAPPLTLALHLDLTNGTDRVTGSVSDGNWNSRVVSDRNVFNALFNPAQQAGVRSFILERAQDNAAAAAGMSRISPGGSTNVRGKLSDGRVFATASALARNGDCPFYLSMNHGNEVVIGWLNFPATQSPAASGTVLWVQTGTNSFATMLQAASPQ